MGVQGLMELLKPYGRVVDLKKYAGRRVGVDAMVWLHRGAIPRARELIEEPAAYWADKPKPHVSYVQGQLSMLHRAGIVPVLVFDGLDQPSKAGTQEERREKRAEAQKQLAACRGRGERAPDTVYHQALRVTDEMVHELVLLARMVGVECIMAPYEADPQLAYLSRLGGPHGVAAVITEDSDLTAFGCKTILFKARDGKALEVEVDEVRQGGLKGRFKGITPEKFNRMCALAGCDYLKSPYGMGIITAKKFAMATSTLEGAVEKVKAKFTVEADHLEKARKAELCYLYSRVYDPATGALTHLNPLPAEVAALADTAFLGPDLEPGLLKRLVAGDVRPEPPFEPFHMLDPVVRGGLEPRRAAPPAAKAERPKNPMFKRPGAAAKPKAKVPAEGVTLGSLSDSPEADGPRAAPAPRNGRATRPGRAGPSPLSSQENKAPAANAAKGKGRGVSHKGHDLWFVDALQPGKRASAASAAEAPEPGSQAQIAADAALARKLSTDLNGAAFSPGAPTGRVSARLTQSPSDGGGAELAGPGPDDGPPRRRSAGRAPEPPSFGAPGVPKRRAAEIAPDDPFWRLRQAAAKSAKRGKKKGGGKVLSPDEERGQQKICAFFTQSQ